MAYTAKIFLDEPGIEWVAPIGDGPFGPIRLDFDGLSIFHLVSYVYTVCIPIKHPYHVLVKAFDEMLEHERVGKSRKEAFLKGKQSLMFITPD